MGSGGGWGWKAPPALQFCPHGAPNEAPGVGEQGRSWAQASSEHVALGHQGVRARRSPGGAAGAALTLPRFFPDPPKSISPRHRPGACPSPASLGPPGQAPLAAPTGSSLQGQRVWGGSRRLPCWRRFGATEGVSVAQCPSHQPPTWTPTATASAPVPIAPQAPTSAARTSHTARPPSQVGCGRILAP